MNTDNQNEAQKFQSTSNTNLTPTNENSGLPIETLDFNSEPQKNIENPDKNTKNGLGIVFAVLLIMGTFIFLLPYIKTWLNKPLELTKTKTESEELEDTPLNFNLYNNMIQIGEDSYSTISNIKFYDFKNIDGGITFNYTSSQEISDIENLSLYIELYDKDSNLIFRTQFAPKINIEQNSVASFKIDLTTNNIKDLNYSKVVEINENSFLSANEITMTCTLNKNEEEVNLNYEIQYFFKLEALTKYSVSETISTTTEESAKFLKYKEEMTNEYNKLLENNIENVVKEENSLAYSIDFNSLGTYTSRYNKGTLRNEIKASEASNDWICN